MCRKVWCLRSEVWNTKRNERGIATLELALVLPFLLLLLLGAVEFGRAIFIQIAVSNAARAGVQYGAQSQGTAGDNPGIRAAAINDFAGTAGLSLSFPPSSSTHFCQCSDGTPTSCTLPSCGSGRVIEFVQVDTAVTFASLFHYPGLPGSFTLNGSAVMRVGM